MYVHALFNSPSMINARLRRTNLSGILIRPATAASPPFQIGTAGLLLHERIRTRPVPSAAFFSAAPASANSCPARTYFPLGRRIAAAMRESLTIH